MTCPKCGGVRLSTHISWDGSRPVSGFLCADCGNKFATAPAAEPVVEVAEDETVPRTRRTRATEEPANG